METAATLRVAREADERPEQQLTKPQCSCSFQADDYQLPRGCVYAAGRSDCGSGLGGCFGSSGGCYGGPAGSCCAVVPAPTSASAFSSRRSAFCSATASCACSWRTNSK